MGLPGREGDLKEMRDVIGEGWGATEQGRVVGWFEGRVGGVPIERVLERA